MSDQLWASCNLDLWTAGVCQTNLHDSLSPVIKQTPSMAATIAQSVLINTYYTHYFTIISIICIIIHIISNLAIQIWVHIHCRKLASRHIHDWGSVRKQNHEQEGLKYQSITNCPWPTAILPEADPSGYALRMYAIHPARIAGLKLSPNSSTVWAMAARLSCQMWSAIPSSIRTWKRYNQYNTYNRYN